MAWVRPKEPLVWVLIGRVQVGFPFQGVEVVDLHRTVLAVPSGVVLLVSPDLG